MFPFFHQRILLATCGEVGSADAFFAASAIATRIVTAEAEQVGDSSKHLPFAGPDSVFVSAEADGDGVTIWQFCAWSKKQRIPAATTASLGKYATLASAEHLI
jgi:hypothetical protein